MQLEPVGAELVEHPLEVRAGAARGALAITLQLVRAEPVVAAAGEQPGGRQLRVERRVAARTVADQAVGGGLVRRLVLAEADVAVLAKHLHATVELVGELLEHRLELAANVRS